MILDFSVPQSFSVTVGGYDISAAVTSLLCQHPLADIYTPLVWQGQIELASLVDNTIFAESFDDLSNPSRWAPGQHPIVVGFGSTFQTFRIARNGYTYDETVVDGADVALARIELTDILGLLDSYVPYKDAPGITIGADTHWETIVRALIQQAATEAGVSVSLSLDATGIADVFQGPLTVSSGSYIKEAQKLAGERGYWLWCDNEVIKWAKYPDTIPAPIYQRSRRNVELFKRQTGFEPPLNELTIASAYQAHEACSDKYPREYLEFGNKGNDTYIQRRTTVSRSINEEAGTITYTETIEATTINAFPPPYTLIGVDLYNLYKIQETRTTETYEPIEGKLIKKTIEVDKAIGLYEDFRDLLPTAFWFSVLSNCEKFETTYTQADTGELESVTTDEYAPAFTLYSFNGVTSIATQSEPTLRFRTIQAWVEECPGNYTERVSRYRRTQADSDSALYDLIYLSGSSTPNTQPPEQPTRDATYPLVTKQVSGTVKQDYTAVSSFAKLSDTQTAETLVNESGCQALAALKMRLDWQRYYSRYISHPLTLSPAYAPFQCVHVHNGAFIRDGFKIIVGDGDGGLEAATEFTGNFIGTITAVTDTPPITPATPVLIFRSILTVTDDDWPTDTIRQGSAPAVFTLDDNEWPVEILRPYRLIDYNLFTETLT